MNRRLDTIGLACYRLGHARGQLRKIDRFSIQEGLISELWQAWCYFCRSTLLLSLKGATTTNGLAVTSPHAALSMDEIRYFASQAAKNNGLKSPKPIKGDHSEPTWGDLRVINNIIQNLSPSNSSQLLSAFGAPVMLGDMQIVRNACAHLSGDRFSDINSMRVRYDETKYLHPSDALFWIDPATRGFSWSVWIDEMKLAAEEAVK